MKTGMGWAGLGFTADGAMVHSSPWWETGSGPHTAAQTSSSSSSAAPRFSNGAIEAAAHWSVDHPVPRPATSRPRLATSRAASERASWNGACRAATSTLVPSLGRSVAAAASASVTSGSAQLRKHSGQGCPGTP